MQSQGGNYKDKVCLVSAAKNSFIEADKLHAGKSKGKAALMLLKSFLFINNHLFRRGFYHGCILILITHVSPMTSTTPTTKMIIVVVVMIMRAVISG